MDTPTTRREFERHIAMLVEGIRQGKYHFPSDPRIINTFRDARQAPNLRTNFLTVNEQLRLMANSRAAFAGAIFKKLFEDEQQKRI